MKSSLSDFVQKVVVYYSRSKQEIVIGFCEKVVKSPKTQERALLVHDYVSGKPIVLRKTPKILTLEMYELQNKMRFRIYFLLKMLGYNEISSDVINLDKTVRQYIPKEKVDVLENHLNGNKVIPGDFSPTAFYGGF